ncbi:hypothetical protein WMF28_23355 [Sorangium sp. So ce590]|uniref:hypothetical protein n=1 Tax=Sorangium sp. So ce590 TaxID=3133317 RepID=UPI003F5E2905
MYLLDVNEQGEAFVTFGVAAGPDVSTTFGDAVVNDDPNLARVTPGQPPAFVEFESPFGGRVPGRGPLAIGVRGRHVPGAGRRRDLPVHIRSDDRRVGDFTGSPFEAVDLSPPANGTRGRLRERLHALNDRGRSRLALPIAGGLSALSAKARAYVDREDRRTLASGARR